ncbi:hypothetical protein FRC06_009550 [Ceratobasidium sp. 370]|nr:hypothetical protein FRC06_009550 [Ceratobasidium sp. 370]
MSDWRKEDGTRAVAGNSRNGPDVYYIINEEYGTGVRIPEDADRAALVGYRQTEDEVQGYRWKLLRHRNTREYRIYNEDLKWFAVRGHANPDSVHTGRKNNDWWIIMPSPRKRNCYLIQHVSGGGYWGLEEGSDGTTIKLRESTGDDANLWRFEPVPTITSKIPSTGSPWAPNSFESSPANRNESQSATMQPFRVPQTPGVKTCPPPTPAFTGRRDIIEQIKACISCGDRQRCVFVLHGLGGVGKTQLALKAIEETKDMWTDILFVDATSRETATSALEAFAKDRKVGQTERDTMQWLESRRERWLILFDNADDPSARIDDFFPGGNYGSILITTRIPGMALHTRGPNSEFGVSSMEPGDALELLLKTAGMQGNVLEEAEHMLRMSCWR